MGSQKLTEMFYYFWMAGEMERERERERKREITDCCQHDENFTYSFAFLIA